MLTEPHRIHVTPDSELARLLDEVGETPILLEKSGKVYRLMAESEENLWAGYDAENARAALEKMTSSWADLDTDKLIADIYRARDEGSRPTTRP